MKTMAIFLGAVLALWMAAPVAAEVVDFGDGIKWDTTRLEQAQRSTAPADAEYHRASEPGKHIPPEAARPVYGPTQVPAAVPCEVNPQHHASQGS